MKNFVLKMAESPLVLKNNIINKNNNLLSSRLLTFSNTISKNKNFSIKNYKSDKQRVDEIMQNKAILDKYLDKIEKSKKKQEKIYKITHEPKLVQPSMRFTARSDLERIYDLIKDKDNYYSKKKEIKRQLAKLGFKSHSIEENLDESLGEPIIDEIPEFEGMASFKSGKVESNEMNSIIDRGPVSSKYFISDFSRKYN